MTIGEKIKYHRTKLGLSQEKLGQKLLVSRQTISLWENDQTAPTIDNLIRLKDIFNVSIDNILNCENDEKINASPIESYTFKYTRDELTTLANISSYNRFKKLIWPIFWGFILFIIFCINSFQGESDYNFFTGIILSLYKLF